jgi:hypothetical protein
MGFSKAKATVSKMAPATVRARRVWWRPGVLVALGALALSSGFAQSAQASESNASHTNPSGAIKLPKSSLKRVGGVVCGKVAGRWIPGTALSGGYFLSDGQQAHNYAARGRHESGRVRKTDLGHSKLYAQRAKQRQPICAPAGSTGHTPGAPSGMGATAPSSPAPSGATSPVGGSSAPVAPLPAGGASPTPTPTPPAGGGSPTPAPPTITPAAVSVGSAVAAPGAMLPVTGSGFAPGSVVQLELHSTPMSLGSVMVGSDGTFRTNVTIPSTVEGGQHHIVGNGIGTDGGATSPAVALAVDASPPQLKSFSVSPTVDTSNGSATVTVTAEVTDDLSGVSEPGYTHGVPEVRFASPSGVIADASFGPGTRISGDKNDGVYRATITLPQYSEKGTWTLQWFELVDMVGNTSWLHAQDMQNDQFPTTFNNG